MMIKITESCSMGCKHCMNDAKPDGRDMSLDTLRDTLDFLKKHNIGQSLIITGGEPLEHRSFEAVMGYIAGWNSVNHHIDMITITTNGEMILKDPNLYKNFIDIFKAVGIQLFYQVSADVRYYPRRIETHKRIFREPGFVLCDDCVLQMYPQGRARENDLPWDTNGEGRKPRASKCFNVRSIAHQTKKCTLKNIEDTLLMAGKMCTPHIKVDGSIGLGESDLCPSFATIYNDEKTIIKNILNFRCKGCSIINDRLPKPLRELIGED